MPLLLVKSGRNPMELFVSVGILFLLLYSLVHGRAPSRVVESGLPQAPAMWLWGSLCGIGAAITLVGLWMERTSALTGLAVERAGQFALGCGISAYVALLWSESTFDLSGIPIVMGTALALGALGRVVQITRGLTRIAKGEAGS